MPNPPVQTTQVQTEATPAPIQVAKHARNRLVPHAVLETELANSLDFVAAIRGKNLFTWRVPMASIPAGAGGTRVRWRGAGHTSPMTRRLRARVYMASHNVLLGVGNAPTVTITVTNANESTVYGTASHHFGASSSTPSDTPDRSGETELRIACPADTDVYIKVEDTEGGRIIACSITEEMLPVTAANGYLVPKSVGVSTPIYDARRETALELATLLWKRAGAQLWNWSVDNQASPATNASATRRNVIDATTSVSAASTGPTLDTRYCRTLGHATVPCVLAVYAKMSGASDTGEIALVNSAGTDVAVRSVTGTTAKWYTVAFEMPAALDKYDLVFSNPDFAFGGETISIGAASLFQYAA